MPRFARNAYALAVVMIGWVFFRASDLTYAITYLRRMFALDAAADVPVAALDLITTRTIAMVAVTACLAFPLWPWAKSRAKTRWSTLEQRSVLVSRLVPSGFVATVIALCFASMASQQSSPFLYYRF
jgi:alginate O-acetyltransferase complex protein AlgI